MSATTRPRREKERDGVDYQFLTREEFDDRRRAGEFLEWAEYNGNCYGTLRTSMEEALRQGYYYVLEIEVQGTSQLRENGLEGVYVFIAPPDTAELRARLERRGQDAPEEIEKRLAIAEREMASQHLFDHVVVNRDLEATVAEVKRLVGL